MQKAGRDVDQLVEDVDEGIKAGDQVLGGSQVSDGEYGSVACIDVDLGGKWMPKHAGWPVSRNHPKLTSLNHLQKQHVVPNDESNMEIDDSCKTDQTRK